jgi:hypothetical protein
MKQFAIYVNGIFDGKSSAVSISAVKEIFADMYGYDSFSELVSDNPSTQYEFVG